ncbi:DUF2953 domain-containing protein [Candidatus Parcubacteria bacterium]|nr:MAG: DUF2953 domain-containing protein [Candidatus Parcubacteria bacterium]
MHYPVIFFAVFGAALIIFMNTRAKIVIEYLRNDKDDHIVLSAFALGGIINYKYEIPLIDLGLKGIKSRKVKKKGGKEKVESRENKMLGLNEIADRYKYLKDLYKSNKLLFKYLKKRALADKFELFFEVGTGDACSTGIISGTVWAFAGMIDSFFSNNFRIKRKKVRVNPNFVEKVFKVDLLCIFSIKVVHIIVVAFKILYKLIRDRLIRKNRR